MPISDEPNKILYYTDGTVREFSFNFKFFNTSDIHVSFWTEGEGVYLEENKDYEIDYTDKEGGSVVLLGNRGVNGYPATPYPGTLLISRVMPLDQQANIRPVSGFPEEVITNTFDKLVMIDQQQEEELQRCLKLPGNSLASDLTLPEPLANNSLIWDEDGTKLVNYDLKGENEAFKKEIVELNQVLEGNINTQFNNFKSETNQQFSNFKTEINDNIETFKNDINTNIEEVLEASEKVNQLEQSVTTATNASKVATEQATIAKQQATIATNKANEAINASTETKNQINTRANLDLSNLSTTGEKHFLNKTQITNCLLEVPQNIKCEVTDSGFTLKAGSVVIFPNGTGNFEHYIITKDMTLASYGGASDDFFICIRDNKTSFTAYVVSKTTSGSTAPTGEGLWYDTTNNLVKFYNSSNELQYSGLSFPIAICSRKSGTITGVKQVFNGFGFIGHHTFSYAGIKSLIPNGRNADGTFKNKETITTSINVRDEAGRGSWICFWDGTNILTYGVNNYFEQETVPTFSGQHCMWLNTKENILYSTSDYGATWVAQPRMYLGRLKKTTASGDFVEASFRTPVELVKKGDIEKNLVEVDITNMIMPDYSKKQERANDTEYQASQDGYLAIVHTQSNKNATVGISIGNSSGNYDIEFRELSNVVSSSFSVIPIKKGQYYKSRAVDNYNTFFEYYFVPLD